MKFIASLLFLCLALIGMAAFTLTSDFETSPLSPADLPTGITLEFLNIISGASALIFFFIFLLLFFIPIILGMKDIALLFLTLIFSGLLPARQTEEETEDNQNNFTTRISQNLDRLKHSLSDTAQYETDDITENSAQDDDIDTKPEPFLQTPNQPLGTEQTTGPVLFRKSIHHHDFP